MTEAIKEILTALIFAGVCAIVAYVLKIRKQQILAIITDLIQKAENAITGSGMGAEKKAKVIAQLEAMGIKVNTWLSAQIDLIVKYLNEKSGWFADEATDAAEEAIGTITESTST